MQFKSILMTALLVLISTTSKANSIGSEYQNFNPSVTGLDFTTVHSSETLKPCQCNLGVFFNYAKNTMSYSSTYFLTGEDLAGRRASDSIIGADLNLATGLTKNLDFGLAMPFIMSGKNQDAYGVNYFEKFGLTELRPMMKYRWYGDDAGGFATVLSANFNRLANNPFAGENPGPTVNFELAADTTADSGTKFGFNLGYRKRNPGKKVVLTGGETPPFETFKDSLIYSVAVASSIGDQTAMITELNGSKPLSADSDAIRKAQEALEISLGIRHEWSKNLNLHAGGATHLGAFQATPDMRVYFGLNFAFEPFCESNPPPLPPPPPPPPPVVPVIRPSQIIQQPKKKVDPPPVAVMTTVPQGVSEVIEFYSPVSATNPADISEYTWKIGSTAAIDCKNDQGYSVPTAANIPATKSIGDLPDGSITACVLAKGATGVWQPTQSATSYTWTKKKGYELFRINANVLFDFDKDTLQGRSYVELEKIAKHLQQRPFRKVIIEGFTDSKGSDSYNLELSKRRALRVKNYLIEKFDFLETKLESYGKGETSPFKSNETEEGRSLNRRVEFKIYRK